MGMRVSGARVRRADRVASHDGAGKAVEQRLVVTVEDFTVTDEILPSASTLNTSSTAPASLAFALRAFA